jgi:hypothetical protein
MAASCGTHYGSADPDAGTDASAGVDASIDANTDGGAPAPPIAFVQVATASAGSVASLDVTLTAPVRSHDAVIVCFIVRAPAVVAAVTDPAGNVYATVVGPVLANGFNHYVAIATDVTGGFRLVTVKPSYQIEVLAYAHEYTGLARSNAFDVSASASATAATPGADGMASGFATTSADGELILGFGDTGGAAAGTMFNARSMADGNITEDSIGARAGRYQATATMQGGTSWTMIMATFRGP